MRKLSILYIFIFIAGAFACNSASSNGGKFDVSGKITDGKSKDISGKIIYLKEIDFNKEAPVTIDSQKVAADGTFKLHSSVAGQHMFIISYADGFPYLLINDNDDITYNFDASNPLHPTVKGSDATMKLYSFINEYRLKDSSLNSTLVQLDSLSKLPTTTHIQDSTMEVLGKQKNAQLNDINTSVKNFIKNSNNPISVFYVMNTMSPRTMEPKDLLPIAQGASDRFKSDGTLAAFVSKVKEAVADNDQQDSYNKDFALLNQPAPDLVMQSPQGNTIKISDFKGKYLLVDFWASWCGPCRAENPNVVKAFNKFKDKNFTILGVSLDQDKDAWIKAIQNDKLTWNHMSDLKQWESAAVNTYHFNAIPFNVLIDPFGKIIAADLRGNDLEDKLNQIFNGNSNVSIDSSKIGKG